MVLRFGCKPRSAVKMLDQVGQSHVRVTGETEQVPSMVLGSWALPQSVLAS